MTTFHFFDHNGQFKFSRDDAAEFTHIVESMSFDGSFPLQGNIPVAGDLIGWIDDDDLWEMHEICTYSVDVFGTNFEITGNHIAIVELGKRVTASLKIDNKTLKSALTTILSRSQIPWQLGTLPADADDSEVAKQRYKVTASSVKMYSKMSTSSKVLSTYKKGRALYPIEKTSNSWWKMQGSDGRVGWIHNPTTTLTRNGNAADSDRRVDIDEKWINLWEALEKAQKQTGVIIVPRVEVNRNGIQARYIDVRSQDPEYRGVRLTCNTNITDGVLKYDTTNLYTAMVGVGYDDMTFSSVVWSTSAGFPVNKPSGQAYVEIPEATTAHGRNGYRLTGVVYFDTIKDKNRLLSKTYDYLQVMSNPMVSVDGTVADLYELGYGGQSLRLYDMVHVILEPLNARVQMRVTALTRDLVKPERSKPTIGTISNDDMLADLAGAINGAASIESWQLNAGAVGSTAIGEGAVISGKIAVDAVQADAIAAGAVTAGKLAADSVTANAIAAGAVTTDALAAGAVTAEKADIGSITAGVIASQEIHTEILTAAQAAVGTANIDYAQIKYTHAGTTETEQLIARDAVTDKMYIAKLQVDNAQLVNATVSNLVIKASDGNYYRLDVAADGSISPTAVTPTEEQVEEGQMGTGSIIETDLTVSDLSATSMKAINALIDKLTAARIEVGELTAREAFINALKTKDIYTDSVLRLSVRSDISSEVGTFVRLDDDGIEVGKTDSASTVHIDDDSVDINTGGVMKSSFTSQAICFGNYELRMSADGGLVFKKKEA